MMAKIKFLFFIFYIFFNLKNCSPFSVNNYSEQTNEIKKIKRAKTLLHRCPFFSHFAGKFCNSSHSILYTSHYLWLVDKQDKNDL